MTEGLRPGGVPPRPDVARPATPPRIGHSHSRRTDPTLVGVLVIFLAGALAAATIAIAGPAPAGAGPPPAGPTGPAREEAGRPGPGGPFAFLARAYVAGRRERVRWNPCQP